MTLEEADGCVVIRPVPGERAFVKARLREARGVANAGATTDGVMRGAREDWGSQLHFGAGAWSPSLAGQDSAGLSGPRRSPRNSPSTKASNPAVSRTRFSRSKKGCPALVGRSAVATHIGDGCRAAGFFPIAIPSSLRHPSTHGDPDLPTFATGW